MVSRARKPYVVSLAASLPWVRTRKVRAADLGDASRVCRAYIEEHDLGAGNWSGGAVRDHTGALVGRVSYNGKVWGPAGGPVPLWPAAVELPCHQCGEAESECPNCHNGTVGKEDGRIVCRGECGAFLTDES